MYMYECGCKCDAGVCKVVGRWLGVWSRRGEVDLRVPKAEERIIKIQKKGPGTPKVYARGSGAGRCVSRAVFA